MYILCKPFIFRLKPFDGTRLYNTCFRPVLPYTANYAVLRHSGIYWTIAAQAEKQTDGIFSVLSAFPANMGIYPFLALKRLYGQIMALYGKLCRFGICPIVSVYAVRLSGIVSGCPAVQYWQGIPMKYYVNLPTCPLEHYVNRSDPQENSWLRSICLARSGSGRIPADGSGTL